jgi:uncharacterized protein (TIGR02246 family)
VDVAPDLPSPRVGPERVSHAFAAALGRGDLRASAACFARDACLITPDGTAVHGRQQIKPVLAQLIFSGAEVAIELSSALIAGDVAFAHERWTICRRGLEGTQFSQTIDPNLVLRRIDARWKLAIASPWAISRDA